MLTSDDVPIESQHAAHLLDHTARPLLRWTAHSSVLLKPVSLRGTEWGGGWAEAAEGRGK